MLHMPRRSVTRFFIPLIDVLTLLFCIFLMAPAIKKTAEADGAESSQKDDGADREKRLKDREEEVKKREDQLRRDLEGLQQTTTGKVLNNLSTRVFEIDPKTGDLFYRDPDRVQIAEAKQVQDLIRRDRDRAGPGHEIYYVILYPRDALAGGGVPSPAQKDAYDRWFVDVPHRYDIPWESAGGGKKP